MDNRRKAARKPLLTDRLSRAGTDHQNERVKERSTQPKKSGEAGESTKQDRLTSKNAIKKGEKEKDEN